jgi:hypothetical protein
LAKIASGSPPPLVSNRIGQRNKREKSGVRMVRLWLDSLVGFAKKDEKRKENEKDLMNLAEIHLNFEKL